MNEINRLQQLAGILTEVKVNKPGFPYFKQWKEEISKHMINVCNEDDYYCELIEPFNAINDPYEAIEFLIDNDYLQDNNEDRDYNEEYIKTGIKHPDLHEDVSGFNIGQTKQSDGHKSTVVDVNPETQSVTWDIKKDITDKEIHDDLSKIIRKFETVQVKDFHSRPKLIQLIKDLKTIRNKFSRTVVKEERTKLINQLGGLLKEIKVNKPINYNLKELQHFYDISDLNNPNKEDMQKAEDILIKIGFLSPDGSISNIIQDPLLKQLENWVETERT